MKKTKALIMVGMLVIVGCGSIVIAEEDDTGAPNTRVTNRAPDAPVFVLDKSDWDKENYAFVFYATDPDGDSVYYNIQYKKISDSKIVTSSPNDPDTPWFGPFESSKEVGQIHEFYKRGTYELTVRAKDTHGSIGPSTTITVTYKSSLSQFPILSKLMAEYPRIFNILTKIF